MFKFFRFFMWTFNLGRKYLSEIISDFFGSKVSELGFREGRAFFPKRRYVQRSKRLAVRKSRRHISGWCRPKEARTIFFGHAIFFGGLLCESSFQWLLQNPPQKMQMVVFWNSGNDLSSATRETHLRCHPEMWIFFGSHQEVGKWRVAGWGWENASDSIRNITMERNHFWWFLFILTWFSWDRNPRFCCDQMVTFFQGNREDIPAKHAFLQTESSQRREQKVEHVLRVLPLLTMGIKGTYFPEVVNIFPRSGEINPQLTMSLHLQVLSPLNT